MRMQISFCRHLDLPQFLYLSVSVSVLNRTALSIYELVLLASKLVFFRCEVITLLRPTSFWQLLHKFLGWFDPHCKKGCTPESVSSGKDLSLGFVVSWPAASGQLCDTEDFEWYRVGGRSNWSFAITVYTAVKLIPVRIVFTPKPMEIQNLDASVEA